MKDKILDALALLVIVLVIPAGFAIGAGITWLVVR